LAIMLGVGITIAVVVATAACVVFGLALSDDTPFGWWLVALGCGGALWLLVSLLRWMWMNPLFGA
jgi:hypothetical protein